MILTGTNDAVIKNIHCLSSTCPGCLQVSDVEVFDWLIHGQDPVTSFTFTTTDPHEAKLWLREQNEIRLCAISQEDIKCDIATPEEIWLEKRQYMTQRLDELDKMVVLGFIESYV